jgi:hypothetical protein
MNTFRTMRENIYRAYWYLRLAGRKVDPSKNIIYRTRNWHFVVEADGYKTHRYNKYRLHLHCDEKSGRITKVTIG